MVVAKPWEKVRLESYYLMHTVSVWEEEKVQELDSGNGGKIT